VDQRGGGTRGKECRNPGMSKRVDDWKAKRVTVATKEKQQQQKEERKERRSPGKEQLEHEGPLELSNTATSDSILSARDLGVSDLKRSRRKHWGGEK